MRAAIYARFSTDLQNEKSTEDQLALCRKFAVARGYTVVAELEDKAKSGASTHGRQGLEQLLKMAHGGRIDAIIVEALDRLSRDMEDMSGIYKRLSFANVSLIPVDTGHAAGTVEVGLRGLIGQLYREDNVHKIRRGMSGLVRNGLSAGGKIYGYEPDRLNKGKLLIKEDEAEIVRRIFEEYVAGRSPRNIAHDLNRDKVPAPRGYRWAASTLNGQADRGAGILRNSIYVGRPTWNKVRMLKNPETGRRISRTNPASEWQTASLPELRLVPDPLWEQVQLKLHARAIIMPAYSRQPKRLLSGLLACGACGSGIAVSGTDKSGKVRVKCSGHTNSRSCPNPRSYYLEKIETMFLDSLAAQLDEPDLLTEYLETYEAERRRLRADIDKKRHKIEGRITEISAEVDRLVDFVAKGVGSAVVWGQKVDELCREKGQLVAELEECEDDGKSNVMLHPTVVKEMAKSIVQVRAMLKAHLLVGDEPVAQVIRSAISKVTVVSDPEARDGFHIKVDGRLDAFTTPSSGVLAVAEVRSDQYHTRKERQFSYVFPELRGD